MGVEAAGEIPSLTGEFVGETHRVLEPTQKPPPRNQHQKGPSCLWVVVEVTESQQRAKQASLFPLGPFPHIQYHNAVPHPGAPPWLPHPGEYLRLHPLQHDRYAETKKNMAQMKDHVKVPEKIQLSDKEIANLSNAEFKTLVIKILTEMVGYGGKTEEKVKPMQSEIKKNI